MSRGVTPTTPTCGEIHVAGRRASDYWGGRRVGANLFAESLVCLDARTGERRWHFYTVHHGVWDYDLSAAPNLVTITVDGRALDAVAQVAKNGFTYVFDRRAGVADRGARGRYGDGRAGRGAVSDAAVPDQAAAVQRTGGVAGGRERPDDRDPRAGGGADAEVPAGSAVSRRRACRARCSARARAAAPTGAGRHSTPRRGCCTCAPRKDVDTNQVCANAGNDPEVDVA